MTAPIKSTQGQGGAIYAASLLGFGGTIVGLALKNLSLDDPRWTHNAWSYVYGVPVGIIAISLLSQAFANRIIERTVQAAFLLSLSLHLFLATEASRFIVLGRNVDASSQGKLDEKDDNATEQNYSSVSYQPQFDKRPPESIANSITRSEIVESQVLDTTIENTQSQPEMPQQELELLRKDLDLDDQQLSQLEIEQQQAEAQQAEISSRAVDINRSQADHSASQIETTNRDVVVPEQTFAPEANPLELANSLPSSLERNFQEQSDAPKVSPSENVQAPRGPSGFQPNLRARDTNLQASSARQSEQARQREVMGTLELEMRQRARGFQSMPRSDSIGNTLSPSDMVLGNVSAIVPQGAGNSTDALPETDVSDLGVARSGEMLSGPRSSNGNSGNDAGRGSLSNQGSALAGSTTPTANTGPSSFGPRNTDIRPRGMESPRNLANVGTATERLPNQIGQGLKLQLERAVPGTGVLPTQGVPAPAFARRADRNSAQSQDADLGQWGPQTEAAIEAGLKFLAKYQHPNGSWSLADFGDRPLFASDTAATALALLCFQGAGYSHLQYQYQDNCKRALEFLISNQQDSGDLYIPMDELSDRNSRFYSHGIAALALCEAFGMTQDEALRVPAQKSIDFLLATQDPLRGGWRYAPQLESDTSVTGWCMMAMKSAELAGLEVNRQGYVAIEKYLDQAQASPDQPYLYRYNYAAADTPQTRHGLTPNPTMTSVGLLLRLYLGWRRDNSNMVLGAEYLLGSIPELGTVRDPKRDTYYWYYATQVMFHMGGEYWKAWNTALHPMLIQTQLQRGDYAGSWDPGGKIPDRWGSFAGRLYVTTLNLLSLEVYYRHLPIYEETAR